MELYHHGILKQRWGVRNGPPYPLKGGQYSPAEKRAKKAAKRHAEDHVISKGTTLNTLSNDPNRTKNTDMFYAAHTKIDKRFYMDIFNQKMTKEAVDENGNTYMTKGYKLMINNKAAKNINVAGEDQSIKIFEDLFKKDRDFSNFVTDKDRMQKYFEFAHWNKKRAAYTRGYRQAFKALDKLDGRNSNISENDMRLLYRVFNYTLPYDGSRSDTAKPDTRGAKDVVNQRAKFFKMAKKNGYGAILDGNDTLYGHYKADKPVIVFDMEKIVPDKVWQTKASDHNMAALANAFSLENIRTNIALLT